MRFDSTLTAAAAAAVAARPATGRPEKLPPARYSSRPELWHTFLPGSQRRVGLARSVMSHLPARNHRICLWTNFRLSIYSSKAVTQSNFFKSFSKFGRQRTRFPKEIWALCARNSGLGQVFSTAGKMHSDLPKKSVKDSTLEHSLFAAFNTAVRAVLCARVRVWSVGNG